MNTTIDRDTVVRRIAEGNEQAVRMGLMFNQQTEDKGEPSNKTLDADTDCAIGIMSAAGDELSNDEESLLHLVDGLNWSEQQSGNFLKVLAEGS